MGQLLRELKLVPDQDIEKAANRQADPGQRDGAAGKMVIRRRSSPLGLQVSLWLLALIVFAVAHWMFDAPPGTTATLCGFLATAACWFVQYRIDHRVWLSLYHVGRIGLPFLAAAMTLYISMRLLAELGTVEQSHALSTEGRQQLEAALRDSDGGVQTFDMERLRRWVFELQIGVGVVAIMLMLAMTYGIWKFRAMRIVESRTALLEGLMVRLRECLANTLKPDEDRRREALHIILETVRSWTRLNAWDPLRAKLPEAWVGRLETIVYYLVPIDSAGNVLRQRKPSRENPSELPPDIETARAAPPAVEEGLAELSPDARENSPDVTPTAFLSVACAYNPDASTRVKQMHEFIKEHYRPRRWNQEAFLKQVNKAKGNKPKGWRSRFLALARDPEIGSVTGYAYATREVVPSDDASHCLAFDDSLLQELKAGGFSDDEIAWVTVGSFIACPIPGDGPDPSGVLFVAKTYKSALGPEDEEITVAASELISTLSL